MASTDPAPAPLASATGAALLQIRQFSPAIELQCLCHFAALPFALSNAAYPLVASTGELPQVQAGGALVGGSAALELVRARAGLEAGLAPLQRAHARAALALVHGVLGDVERWCASDGGAAAVLHATPAPFGWMLARVVRAGTQARLQRQGLLDEPALLRARAEEAYAALESMLRAELDGQGSTSSSGGGAGGPYFFGVRPSSLDAAVYAHLAAVRHRAAGQWVLACAPSLPAYFEDLRAAIQGTPSGSAAAALNREADFYSASDEAAERAAVQRGAGGALAAFALVGGAGEGVGGAGAAPQQREWTTEVKNLAATACIFGVGYYLLVLLLRERK